MSVATIESQLFEFERLEDSLVAIFKTAGLPAGGKFDTATETTPRIELVLSINEPEGHRHIRAPRNTFAPAQPFDVYRFTLTATVFTDRTRNGEQHVPLIGKTRYALQYFRLLETLTEAVSPFHTITSIDEVSQADSVEDEANVQISQLTFRGLLNIRENAWPPQI